MCLYFQEQTKCSHPQCIYIINVKKNFTSDFQKNSEKLTEIQLKQNWSEAFKQNKLKMNENDKKLFSEEKNETKRDKKVVPSGEKKFQAQENHQISEISHFIDFELKLLLNQNVSDFIVQLSSKFTQNLKNQNISNELRLQNLERRLQNLQSKNIDKK